MTQRTPQPDLRPVKESGDLYELQKPWQFEFRGGYLVIPRRLRVDGATGARLLFQRDGMHRAASLEHDFLYIHKGSYDGLTYTRKEADQHFKQRLIEYGIKSWHVTLAYLAVRAFGGIWWTK